MEIAEDGDFFFSFLVEGLFASGDDEVRLDTHAIEKLDRLLGRFAFEFSNTSYERDIGDMDLEDIFGVAEFEDAAGFEEETVLVFADGATEFDDDNIGMVGFARLGDAVDDFVGDMGNGFDVFSFVAEGSLAVDDGFVYLSCSHVVFSAQRQSQEALVISQILVCFQAVFCNKDLTMFLRADGTGIDIKIHVDLDDGDFDTFGLENSAY